MSDKEKNEEVEKKDSIEKKEVVKKKIDIHPIWMYIVAIVLTIFISGFFTVISTFSQIEEKLGKPIDGENISMEEIIGNEEYNMIYTENAYKASAISQCCIFIVLVVILVLTHMKKIKSDMKKWDKKRLIFVLISSVVMIILNVLICNIFVHFNVNMSNQDSLNSMFDSSMIFTAIYLVVLAPIAEEMLFRYSLSTIIKNKVAFVIVSTLLFAIVHGIGIATIVYAVLGLILSLIYVKTEENITAPILAHMINNIYSLITMLLI